MIIIHAAGNEKIGIGNLVRSYSLATELKKVQNELIIIFECKNEISDFINTEQLQIINFIERKDTIKFLKNLKLQYRSNIYISDILDMDKSFEKLIRNIGFDKIIHLNDSCLSRFKPDILIDGDVFKKKWDLEGTEILQSPSFHIVKNEIVQNRPQSSWNKSCANNVLVCFGGTDPAKYTEKILDELKNNSSRLNFNIILGPGFSKNRVKNIIKYRFDSVKFYRNVNKIYELILKSDIVLSLGGGIAYEAMCLGIPTAAVPWEKMRFYVDEMDKEGVLKKISDANIINDLEEMANNIELMKNIAFNGWKMIDGKGNKRIVDYIEKM